MHQFVGSKQPQVCHRILRKCRFELPTHGVGAAAEQELAVDISRHIIGNFVWRLTRAAKRKIRGADNIELLLKGIPFKDGEPVQGDLPVQQKLAA